MPKIFCLFVLVAMLPLLGTVSCRNWDPEIVRNRSSLERIRLDMDKDEVRGIMGEPLSGKPYTEDENVWFYYTDYRWSDSMITRDECTPIVFDEDGKVAGWGREYYKRHVLVAPWRPGEEF